MGAAGFPVIAAAEIFSSDMQRQTKEISATHFSDRQLSFPCPAVARSDWDSGPRISTDDRFKRQLDREVEMRRNQWMAAVDHSLEVGFEGVGRVVQLNVEK